MKINKSGQQIGTKELLELLIGAAAIVILIWLLVALIEPNFDKDKETAKNYFDSLKNAIEEINDAGVGESTEFSIWLNNENKFYLVYFNNNRRYEIKGIKESYLPEKGENLLCICYVEENTFSKNELSCDNNYCIDLDKEGSLCDNSQCKILWDVGGKVFTLNIKNEEDKYVFTEI